MRRFLLLVAGLAIHRPQPSTAESDTFISTQLHIFRNEGVTAGMTEFNRKKIQELSAGLETRIALIKQYGTTMIMKGGKIIQNEL